jgi:hypothetical protein
MTAYTHTKSSLKDEHKHILQKCTWQELLSAVKADSEMGWLVRDLSEKYGLDAES